MANACNDEMLNYQVCIVLSLIFTFVLTFYARTQEYFAQDPQRGMKIYFVCGTIKIFIGVLLFTVLYPVDCTDYVSIYGLVVITISLLWINREMVYVMPLWPGPLMKRK